MKACLTNLVMFCFREKSIGLTAKQQNEKSTQIYQGKISIRSLRITVTMGNECYKGLQLQKNPRRFTLRCISKGIVLVSVRLRSTCSKISKGARRIIRKAEKQLLCDRVKCINTTIKHNGSNINKNRSMLASMVTNTIDIDQCSKFIHQFTT